MIRVMRAVELWPSKVCLALDDARPNEIVAIDRQPLKLKSVREEMIRRGLSRLVINQRINRVKGMLKWAVSEEFLPSSIYEGARTVTALRCGHCNVREAPPVRPVGTFAKPAQPRDASKDVQTYGRTDAAGSRSHGTPSTSSRAASIVKRVVSEYFTTVVEIKYNP